MTDRVVFHLVLQHTQVLLHILVQVLEITHGEEVTV
jgi:hypothetical protein